MNKRVIKELKRLAEDLPRIGHEVDEKRYVKGISILDAYEKSAQNAAYTTTDMPYPQDKTGQHIQPDKYYLLRQKVNKPINYVEHFKKAYKKGGMPAVQSLVNSIRRGFAERMEAKA